MMNWRHDRPKILLVSSKWPSSSDSIDGGDVTLREIIIAIKGSCVVDLLCFRNDVASNVRLDGVRKVYVCRADFAGYDTYSSREEEKFNLRIDQAGFAAHEIERIAGRYDRVVIVHARFLLGVSPNSELWQKCVLFPMFTGTSYSYAGEKVPARYFDLEKSAFSRVACFVTPSMLERRMLLCQYGVPESRVHVIERPVHVGFVERTFCRKEILIVYIASIRIQKNHMAAMTLVKELSRRCLNVRLLCVGAIQDEMIHQECLRYLQKHSLEQRVEFCGSLRHSEVEKVMRSADFNISVSRWETFGRGIYEGIAAGIPTIALNTLRPLVESMFMPVAPALVDNVEKMADMICALQRDPCKYRDVSSKGECLQRYLNLDRIGLRLNDAILSGGNEGRLVLVPERDLLSTHGSGVLNDAKRLFLSKSFVKFVELLQDSDGVPAADLLAVKGNLALGYHLLGEREKAEALYGYAQESEIAVANRLAFFHRYFDYTSANCCVRPDMGRISELVSHNMVNFHIVDSGVDSYMQATGPFAYFSEQILNYVRERRGENLVLKENEKMCRAFAESVQIEPKFGSWMTRIAV